MSFKQKWILMQIFVESQFEVMYFMSFKQNRTLMKAIVDSQFEVMSDYEFQTKENSYE